MTLVLGGGLQRRFKIRNFFRVFGLIALVAVIGFSMAACGGDGGGGGGTVTGVSGGVLTLTPSNSSTTFTATVSGNSITSMDGTITWTDGTTAAAPGALTGGGSGSNPFAGTWVGKDITIVCTDSTWKTTIGKDIYQGTYTYNGNSATFTEMGGGVFGTASISGSTMTVNERANGGLYTLQKQGGSTDNPGGDTPSGGGGKASTFTMTGIPEQYNGKYAGLKGGKAGGVDITGCQKITGKILTLVPISNGSVIIPLFNDEDGSPYTGNDRYGELYVVISSIQEIDYWAGYDIGEVDFYDVRFSNGSATASWSQGSYIPRKR
jgi:hypothetical protein